MVSSACEIGLAAQPTPGDRAGEGRAARRTSAPALISNRGPILGHGSYFGAPLGPSTMSLLFSQISAGSLIGKTFTPGSSAGYRDGIQGLMPVAELWAPVPQQAEAVPQAQAGTELLGSPPALWTCLPVSPLRGASSSLLCPQQEQTEPIAAPRGTSSLNVWASRSER